MNANDCIERYRRFWSQSFDRLDGYLRELQIMPEKTRQFKENRSGCRQSK